MYTVTKQWKIFNVCHDIYANISVNLPLIIEIAYSEF